MLYFSFAIFRISRDWSIVNGEGTRRTNSPAQLLITSVVFQMDYQEVSLGQKGVNQRVCTMKDCCKVPEYKDHLIVHVTSIQLYIHELCYTRQTTCLHCIVLYCLLTIARPMKLLIHILGSK